MSAYDPERTFTSPLLKRRLAAARLGNHLAVIVFHETVRRIIESSPEERELEKTDSFR
jgi:hypothetical protein